VDRVIGGSEETTKQCIGVVTAYWF